MLAPHLWCLKPAVLTSDMIHFAIEVVQIPVAENLVVDDIPLAARIVE
jgi:hypothetical protein